MPEQNVFSDENLDGVDEVLGEVGFMSVANKSPCTIYRKRSQGKNFFTEDIDIYITGEIEHPSLYTEVFHTLRTASEKLNITIHVNSTGGDLLTTLQMCAAMKASKANIHCNIEGLCLSAATLIFFAADTRSVDDFSFFLFHTYSSSLPLRKSHELSAQIAHDTVWVKSLLEKSYIPYLSKEEINDILAGKDLWMDKTEITKRINRVGEKKRR